MPTIADGLIALIGLMHVFFLVVEMFLWEKPCGLRFFDNTPAEAAMTKELVANQDPDNGFLVAGLFCGLSLGPERKA